MREFEIQSFVSPLHQHHNLLEALEQSWSVISIEARGTGFIFMVLKDIQQLEKKISRYG